MVGRRELEGVSLLEALRADKGLTQERASLLAGISHKTLKKYEQQGAEHPRNDVLNKLGQLYGVRSSLLLEDIRRVARQREAEIASAGIADAA